MVWHRCGGPLYELRWISIWIGGGGGVLVVFFCIAQQIHNKIWAFMCVQRATACTHMKVNRQKLWWHDLHLTALQSRLYFQLNFDFWPTHRAAESANSSAKYTQCSHRNRPQNLPLWWTKSNFATMAFHFIWCKILTIFRIVYVHCRCCWYLVYFYWLKNSASVHSPR